MTKKIEIKIILNEQNGQKWSKMTERIRIIKNDQIDQMNKKWSKMTERSKMISVPIFEEVEMEMISYLSNRAAYRIEKNYRLADLEKLFPLV